MRLYFSGGLNENQYPSLAEAASGSYNFNLYKDSTKLVPRAPFDLKGTAPNAGDIRGIAQLIKRDDTETTIIQAGGNIYKWDGATTWTNVGSCVATSQLRDIYWSLGDYSVLTDLAKLTPVSKWDGTTFSTLTTGLGVSLYAKYGVVWQGRTWLFNVKTATDTPHLLVASKFEDPTSYDTTLRASSTTFSATGGIEAFYMLTPDLRPINGACLFFDQLIVSSEGGKLFVLTGNNSTNYAFKEFYPKSNCLGPESIVSAGDDVFYMKTGGAIESLKSTTNFGDVETDDKSRYILSTVNGITSCASVYDQVRQKVLFFVAGKVLVFFKDLNLEAAMVTDKGDRLKVSPWSVYKTLHTSNFTTSAAKYLRIPSGTGYTVYFGDSSGNVYDLNGTGTGGDGGTTAIQVVRKTRVIDDRDGLKGLRHVTRGTVEYHRVNQVSLSIALDWNDEYSTSTASVTLDGATATTTGAYFGSSIYFGGAVYFSQGFQFAQRVSHKNFSHVGKANGCTITVSTEDKLQYQVDHLEFR